MCRIIAGENRTTSRIACRMSAYEAFNSAIPRACKPTQQYSPWCFGLIYMLRVCNNHAKEQHGTSNDVTAVFVRCAQVLFIRVVIAPCLLKEKRPSRTTPHSSMAVSDASSQPLTGNVVVTWTVGTRDHTMLCVVPRPVSGR